MYPEKIEGQVCSNCGKAKYVKSPTTGKVFCADKCWLTTQEKKVESVKVEAKEEKRNDSISLMNAKNNATQIVIAMYNKNELKFDEVEHAIESWTFKINKISQPPF